MMNKSLNTSTKWIIALMLALFGSFLSPLIMEVPSIESGATVYHFGFPFNWVSYYSTYGNFTFNFTGLVFNVLIMYLIVVIFHKMFRGHADKEPAGLKE